MSSAAVVMVTGASRGLGAAVAKWLGHTGAATVLIARSANALQSVADQCRRLGGSPLCLPMDVADSDACRQAVYTTTERYGKMDALVNNAALVGPINPIAGTSAAKWHHTLAVNLLGPFYLTHWALDILRKQNGRVINVNSGAATIPLPSLSAYCCSKAALQQFTEVLAAEEPMITAVSVLPGILDTDMQAQLRKNSRLGMSREQTQYYRDLKDNGRLAPTRWAARSIAWLSLKAPPEFSGKCLSYDDPLVLQKSRDTLGNAPPEGF
jgi:NAD(P)-dependent dehydrogenase (short-subunit alcohol dehydrogenase family)